MFKKMLHNSLVNEKKISIYFSSSESDSFCFGNIVFCNGEHFILSSYTPYGDDDGFLLRKVDEVAKIEIDSKYNKKMESLIEIVGTKHTYFYANEEDIVKFLLEKAKNKHWVLSIELFNSDELVVGYIASLSYPLCEIEQINEYGENDGKLIFNIDDISSIRFKSKDEVILEKLSLTKSN